MSPEEPLRIHREHLSPCPVDSQVRDFLLPEIRGEFLENRFKVFESHDVPGLVLEAVFAVGITTVGRRQDE
jgi:hypothetical protein